MASAELDTNNSGYEKLLLNFINLSRSELVGVDQSRKFTVKDLDNLTPSLFQQIVSLICKERAPPGLKAAINGGRTMHKFKEFNKLFPSYDLSLDTQPEQFYFALKKLFPPQDDILLPSVVINPSGDPMRTRRVLKYLTAYVIYVDKVAEQFEGVYDELENENMQMTDLKYQLDALINEKNTRIIELSDWSNQVPHLQEESKTKQNEILMLQEKADKMEEEVKALSVRYKGKRNENLVTGREIENVQRKIQDLEKQVVRSPMSIRREFDIEVDRLRSINKVRDFLGSQLQKLTERRNLWNRIAEEGNKCVALLDELIPVLQEAYDYITTCKEKEMKNEEKVKFIEELELKVENMRDTQASSADRVNQLVQSQTEALKRLKLEISSITIKTAELKHAYKNCAAQCGDQANKLALEQEKSVELRKNIHEAEHHLTQTLPAKSAELVNLTKEVMEKLKEEFKDV